MEKEQESREAYRAQLESSSRPRVAHTCTQRDCTRRERERERETELAAPPDHPKSRNRPRLVLRPPTRFFSNSNKFFPSPKVLFFSSLCSFLWRSSDAHLLIMFIANWRYRSSSSRWETCILDTHTHTHTYLRFSNQWPTINHVFFSIFIPFY